jgi:hypothetical protein
MFDALKVGDRIRLAGGYDMDPKWLAGSESYTGIVSEFIPGQNKANAAVVRLDQAITVDGISGDILVLELRYEGAKWKGTETVHVELCDFVPESKSWKFRKQGLWVESHATYVKH